MRPTGERLPDESRVRAFWDALVAGDPTPPDADDSGIAATITRFHNLDDAPSLARSRQDEIWKAVLAGEPRTAPSESPFSTNGHRAPESPRRDTRPSAAMRIGRVARTIGDLYRILAIGAMSGLLAGALAGGLGSRLAMRIAGALSSAPEAAIPTSNGNAVGEQSAGGTMALVVLGAAIGILGGIFYMGIRDALPGRNWRKGAVYGGALLFTFGYIVMDKNNPDYRTFGSPGINVGTFSGIYLLFGLLVASIAEWLNRTMPANALAWSAKPRGLARSVAVIVFGAIGGLASFAGFLNGGHTSLFALAILVGAALLRRNPMWFKPREFLTGGARPVLGRALLISPTIAGVVLTVRSVAIILGL